MTDSYFPKAMLPCFKDIRPENVKKEIGDILNVNRQKLAKILAAPTPLNWDTLMKPLEEMGDELSKKWSPISHMHAVIESDAMRKAYNETLPLIIEYHTEIMQNEKLFKAILEIAHSPYFEKLNQAERKIIENDLRDFKLSGIDLSSEKKAHLASLQQELSRLMTTFSENVLDATAAWTLHFTDEESLAGLPTQALQLAQDAAKTRGLEGYLLTLDYPSYSTAIKFLHDRNLRKTLYEAYATRASDRGPNASKWDNTLVMENILKTREAIAKEVGFKNYAEYSLATKMAKTPDEVMRFLRDLLKRSKPIAQVEYKEIASLAKSLDGISTLEVWDMAYYSEKLRESTFHFSQEDLRPYFPVNQVLSGMFSLVNKIYGITIKPETGVDVWHKDVRFFSIYDENNVLRGGFYIDLYARSHKRDGAWMDEYSSRRQERGNIQYPVAYLTCNFMPPVSDKPALLTHDDVLTLFHEFGHCLHHLLTKVNYPSVGGINGVPWDAVEFPSQFMENFCWEKESLDLIASHFETHDKLPDDLYQKMLRAKHFQTGLQMIRQIEFSLFDFELHLSYDPSKLNQIQHVLDQIRKETTVITVPEFNRFQHSFSHVFAGGYAAGYYSYKWAEVLSSDAYAKFEEKGIFDRTTGRAFMENILETGGVRDPLVSFVAFRGREPTIDALLKQSGIL